MLLEPRSTIGIQFDRIRDRYLQLLLRPNETDPLSLEAQAFGKHGRTEAARDSSISAKSLLFSPLARVRSTQSPSVAASLSPVATSTSTSTSQFKTPIKRATLDRLSPLLSASKRISSAYKTTPTFNSPLSQGSAALQNLSSIVLSASRPASQEQASAVDRRLKSAAERKLERERERLAAQKQKEAERLARMERAIAQKQKAEEEARSKKQNNYSRVIQKGKELKEGPAASPTPQTPAAVLPCIHGATERTVPRNGGARPPWSATPEVRKLLQDQSVQHDPESIFGCPRPFDYAEIFKTPPEAEK